eukprot:bmy_12342T0
MSSPMVGTRALLMLENFIDGKFLPCSSYLDSYDPSTGEVYCRVPNSGKEEVSTFTQRRLKSTLPVGDLCNSIRRPSSVCSPEIEAAVEAARAAFPGWSSWSPQERSQVLQRLADLLEQSLEELAQAESRDQGKTLTLARTMDIPRSVQNFRFFASSILHHTSECTQMDHLGCLHYTVRTPVGIGSWSDQSLESAPLLADLEDGSSDRCWQHCDSQAQRADFCDRVDDVQTPGESRIFVQKSIYSEFLKRFVEATRMWKVGIPSDPSADMGALISKAHLEKVRSYIKKARLEGAQILCGEGVDKLNLPPRNQAGYFMLPTVITDIKDESCCMKEEIFGPVTCVVPFDSEEEVIQRANSVKYGLAATVWSGNVGRVHRVAKKLQSGLVWTNCWLIRELNLPFGGMKSSGVGREGAKDSYEFFTEIKTITIKH